MKYTTLFLAALAAVVAGKVADDDIGYFWHFSDTHIYPQYKEGTNPLIGLCRALSGNAGKYGNYNCDTPEVLLSSAVKELVRQSGTTPDFVLYGGDHICMLDTTQSKEMAIERNHNITEYLRYIKKALPETRIFPVIGNHDVVPQFQMPETGPFYVYSSAANEWREFVSEESVKTLNHSAYYTELIAPGLRLIALNTILYYQENLLVSRDLEDPAGQFAWMHNIMDNARKIGERIIITTHIPPGTEYWLEFNRRYLKAFTGYNDVIVAAFYGHEHKEEFRIIRDVTENSDGAHIAFITSSVTPRTTVNPSITLYKYKKTYPFTILDRTPFYMNITESEITGTIRWINTGSEAAEYGVEDFSTESVIKLVDRMETDDDLFNKYYARRYLFYKTDCDESCKKETLCEVKYPNATLYRECKKN